jgi:hypothetical protein
MSVAYSAAAGHYGTSVCDQTNDGTSAIGTIWKNDGTSQQVIDAYGGGCTTYYPPVAKITQFMLCKLGGPCSAIKNA